MSADLRAVTSPADRLLHVIDAFAGRRVLVVADLVADEFIYGRVQRVSREAPVLILEYDRTDLCLGGGANAVHNIRTLGGAPIPVGVIGSDAHGLRLTALLREKKIATNALLRARDYVTPVKTRILAGGVHSTKQQIVRIDKATRVGADVPAKVAAALRRFKGPLDGVLVSDYAFGLVTADVVAAAVTLARARRVPITLDTRHQLLRFPGVTAVTPNEPEVEAALGIAIGHDRRRLENAGRTLLRRLGVQAVLITRGSDGMALFEPGKPALHVPIYGSDEVADVTGAGDTVIATFTLALASGGSPAEASRLANYAGGLVVMKRGTATIAAAELREAVRNDAGAAPTTPPARRARRG